MHTCKHDSCVVFYDQALARCPYCDMIDKIADFNKKLDEFEERFNKIVNKEMENEE